MITFELTGEHMTDRWTDRHTESRGKNNVRRGIKNANQRRILAGLQGLVHYLDIALSKQISFHKISVRILVVAFMFSFVTIANRVSSGLKK